MKLLTVCSGNICRSPLAELFLANELKDVPGVSVSSAGTFAGPGEPMTKQSQFIAFGLGLDPSYHRARFLDERLARDSDLILAMTRKQRRHIVELVPRKSARVFTIREFARLSKGLTDEEVGVQIARFDSDEPLVGVVDLMAKRRGEFARLQSDYDDDVVDPYRQSDEVYELSTQQILPAAREVSRVLKLAVRNARPQIFE